jgi:CspA family cold shock protein
MIAVTEDNNGGYDDNVIISSREEEEPNAVTGGDSTEIIKGKVKWFDNKRGFGFLARDDSGEDVYVHRTALQVEGFDALEDGSSVEFQIIIDTSAKGRGKPTAVKVTGPQGKSLKH